MVDQTLIEAGFRKALDQHGYSFQYAVLRIVNELHKVNSPWFPVVPEFGVEAKGRDTRIDFVLGTRTARLFLVCECKRANPATANWCFAQADWPDKEHHKAKTTAAALRRTPEGHPRINQANVLYAEQGYQVALQVRTSETGEASGSGRGDIEEASTQVCRGLNGLLDFFSTRDDLLPHGTTAWFVPVVFTTAALWTSTVDLGSSDIATGRLPAGDLGLVRKDWLWLDYPQSPGIKHSLLHDPVVPRSLRDIFYAEGLRRVAIVSPTGIEPFLTAPPWDLS